jgi:hypothetical protein
MCTIAAGLISPSKAAKLFRTTAASIFPLPGDRQSCDFDHHVATLVRFRVPILKWLCGTQDCLRYVLAQGLTPGCGNRKTDVIHNVYAPPHSGHAFVQGGSTGLPPILRRPTLGASHRRNAVHRVPSRWFHRKGLDVVGVRYTVARLQVSAVSRFTCTTNRSIL